MCLCVGACVCASMCVCVVRVCAHAVCDYRIESSSQFTLHLSVISPVEENVPHSHLPPVRHFIDMITEIIVSGNRKDQEKGQVNKEALYSYLQ
jgi:hypothetical protein